MKRKSILVMMLGIIFILCSSLAYAQRMGGGMMGQGYGMGTGAGYGGWNQMTTDQQKEWEQKRIKFLKDTLKLRQKLINGLRLMQQNWSASRHC